MTAVMPAAPPKRSGHRRQYSDSFRSAILRRMIHDGETAHFIGREQGISPSVLRRWLKADKQVHPHPTRGPDLLPRRTFTDNQRRRIMAWADTRGIQSAAKHYRITASVIYSWRKRLKAEEDVPTVEAIPVNRHLPARIEHRPTRQNSHHANGNGRQHFAGNAPVVMNRLKSLEFFLAFLLAPEDQ